MKKKFDELCGEGKPSLGLTMYFEYVIVEAIFDFTA